MTLSRRTFLTAAASLPLASCLPWMEPRAVRMADKRFVSSVWLSNPDRLRAIYADGQTIDIYAQPQGARA